MRIKAAIAGFMCVVVCAPLMAQNELAGPAGQSVLVSAQRGKVVEVKAGEGVAHLLRSGDPASLKVEHVGGSVFITPLNQNPADLIVMDRRGQTFRLKFQEIRDAGGKLLPAQEMVVLAGQDRWTENGSSPDGAVDMLRAMRHELPPAGAEEGPAGEIILSNAQVVMTVRKSWLTPRLAGYVVEVQNRSLRPIVVPLQQLTMPGLLMACSRKDVINARGTPDSSTEMDMIVARQPDEGRK